MPMPGYWHLEQMNEITADGIPVLIPPDFSRRTNKPTRLGWNGGGYDFMRSVLATERGTDLNKQRAQLIEPIFGNTKHNRGFTRFHRPGRSAVRPEWRLMATTHNLPKAPPALHRAGELTGRTPDLGQRIPDRSASAYRVGRPSVGSLLAGLRLIQDAYRVSDAWVVIESLEAFRRYKHGEKGVIVIRGASGTKIHHPSCPHVREDSFLEKRRHGRPYYWTDRPETAERRWASAVRCRHPSDPLAGGSGGPEARRAGAATTAPRSDMDWLASGPEPGDRCVRVEAARPLPFEPKTESQRALREQMRNRIGHLACKPNEVLHASFFGNKPVGADVENLLLYNVDESGGTFRVAPGGLRFEYCETPMPRAKHPFTYLYRPMDKHKSFTLWRLGPALARWPSVRVEPADVDRLRMWLQLRRLRADRDRREHWLGPFVVSVVFRPRTTVSGVEVARLVKPMLDATVGSLQTQGPHADVSEAVRRLAQATGDSIREIADLVRDESMAALGSAPRLLTLRRDGIQLCPSDDRCVAAEIVVAESDVSGASSMEITVAAAEARQFAQGP